MSATSHLVFFDTETTGLSPKSGHRICEIGAIKMDTGGIILDEEFHHYINPERIIGEDVIRIHGITNDKVRHSPKFANIIDDFLKFIDGATLVAHNARFDMDFINYQLQMHGHGALKNKVIDTLVVAKKKYPGSPASLDALCRKFNVSLENRQFHGALLDSRLLACVYRKMVMNDQNEVSKNFLSFTNDFIGQGGSSNSSNTDIKIVSTCKDVKLIIKPSEDEARRHEDLVKILCGSW